MIRSSEAMLLLDTSAPTFYKRVKKLWINLVAKTGSTGKASYIREEDLEVLGKAMGKELPTQESQKEKETETAERVEESAKEKMELKLLKEINELRVDNTTLSSKVEEYSGYVEIYKEQLASRENKVTELETERTSLYAQIIKTQVNKSTYQVLFFAILVVVVLTSILFWLNIIQLGIN